MSGVSGSGRAVSPSRCGGSNAATRPVDAGPSPRYSCPSPHRAPGERNGLAWRRPGSASPTVRVSSRIRPTLRARAHSVGVGSGCTEPDAIAGSLQGEVSRRQAGGEPLLGIARAMPEIAETPARSSRYPSSPCAARLISFGSRTRRWTALSSGYRQRMGTGASLLELAGTGGRREPGVADQAGGDDPGGRRAPALEPPGRCAQSGNSIKTS